MEAAAELDAEVPKATLAEPPVKGRRPKANKKRRRRDCSVVAKDLSGNAQCLPDLATIAVTAIHCINIPGLFDKVAPSGESLPVAPLTDASSEQAITISDEAELDQVRRILRPEYQGRSNIGWDGEELDADPADTSDSG